MSSTYSERKFTGGDWHVACDSYGNVRHSRKACVYTVLRDDKGVERIETLAARIPNWNDARLMSAARDLRDALRDVLPVFDNDSTQKLAKVYADVIARAQTALAKADHRQLPAADEQKNSQ